MTSSSSNGNGNVDVEARVYLRQGHAKATVRDRVRANLQTMFRVTNPDGSPNALVDFGFNIKDADGNPVGEIAWSFDPIAEGFEDFEEAWANDIYLTELPTGQVIVAPFGGGAVEDMEDGWSNIPYATAWEDVAAVVGLFDGDPEEAFEKGWRSNESYAFVWEDVSGVIAAFDGGAQSVEDFENDWTAATTI